MAKEIQLKELKKFDGKWCNLKKIKLLTNSAVEEGSEMTGTANVLEQSHGLRLFILSGLSGRVTSPICKILKLNKKSVQFQTDTSIYELKVVNGK